MPARHSPASSESPLSAPPAQRGRRTSNQRYRHHSIIRSFHLPTLLSPLSSLLSQPFRYRQRRVGWSRQARRSDCITRTSSRSLSLSLSLSDSPSTLILSLSLSLSLQGESFWSCYTDGCDACASHVHGTADTGSDGYTIAFGGMSAVPQAKTQFWASNISNSLSLSLILSLSDSLSL